jgi:hypothetical protein
VSDPSETKIFALQGREHRPAWSSLATGEKRRNINFGKKIPSQPTFTGPKANPVPMMPLLIQHNVPLEFLTPNGKSRIKRKSELAAFR